VQRDTKAALKGGSHLKPRQVFQRDKIGAAIEHKRAAGMTAAAVVVDYLLETAYLRTKNDVYAAFVERGIELLHARGRLGAITSRTGFFLSSFQKWREDVLLRNAPPVVFADLGYGVLDSAMVETAAYCLEARS